MKKSIRQIGSVVSVLLLPLALYGCSDNDEEAAAEAAEEQGSTVVEKVVEAVKPSKVSNELLTYIPDDTVLFFGTPEPVADSEYLALLKPGLIQAGSTKSALEEMKAESDGARMLVGFYARYLNALTSDPSNMSSALGIASDWNSAVYTVNSVPVMRVTLAEQAAFDALLDEVQTEQKITPREVTTNDVRVRRYALDNSADASQDIDLVIATTGQHAVVSVHVESLGDAQLNATLGIDKPASSILDAGTLSSVVEKNGFVSALVGFIDHQRAIEMASSSDSIPFLAALKAMDNSSQPETADNPFKDPQCQAEFADIASRWPRTVFGYTQWDTQSNPMSLDGVMRVETSNTEFLDRLKSIQGKLHMPAALVDETAAMVIGLGIDIDALVPFLSWYGESMAAQGWQCEPLQKMASSLATASSPSVSMTGAMLSGVKGATLAVLDAKITGDKSNPLESLDAMITVNTSNPNALVSMLMASPFLGGAQIATDGTPTPLNLPFPGMGNIQPMLVVSENALTVFAGPKSEAIAGSLNQSAPIDSFVSFNIDYGQYMDLMLTSMTKIGAGMENVPEDQREAFEALKAMDMNTGMTVEVGDGSIEFGTTMEMPQ